MIQFFEFTFELSWKTMKDYMKAEGMDVKFPDKNIITNGDIWMDMLEKRNLMTHTYDETKSDNALQLIISDYVPAIFEVYRYFKKIY